MSNKKLLEALGNVRGIKTVITENDDNNVDVEEIIFEQYLEEDYQNDFLLAEATFNKTSISKVVRTLMKLVSKKVGKKAFRVGGKNHFYEYTVKGRKGVMAVYNIGNRSFSINFEPKRYNKALRATSVDYYNKGFLLNKKPDLSMLILADYNSVQFANSTIEFVKNPIRFMNKMKKIMNEDVGEFVDEIIMEGRKKVDPTQFILDVYELTNRKDNFTRPEIFDFAKQLGYKNPPTKILTDKRYRKDMTRGRINLDPDGKLNGDSVSNQKAVNKTPTSNNPDGVDASTFAAKGIRKAEVIQYMPQIRFTRNDGTKFVQFGAAMSREEILYDKAIKNKDKLAKDEAAFLFERMLHSVKSVLKQQHKSVIVVGAAGLGKTFNIMKAVTDSGRKPSKFAGNISPASIYATLFANREKGSLIVFDDIDAVWADAVSKNVLKGALDTTDTEVSWVNARTRDISKLSKKDRDAYIKQVEERQKYGDEEYVKRNAEKLGIEDTGDRKEIDKAMRRLGANKLPSTFEFDGNVIFISNLKRDDIDPAIRSRSLFINMNFDRDMAFGRLEDILEFVGDRYDVPLENKKVLLKLCKDWFSRLPKDKYIPIREFGYLVPYAADLSDPMWKKLVVSQLADWFN